MECNSLDGAHTTGGMMGDIADMMLDGTLCNVCGVVLLSESGIPTNCGCDPLQDYIEDEPSDEEIERRAEKQGWKTT